MMGCAAVRQFVTAYVDGELVGEDRAALEAHLASCSACRRLLDDEQVTAAFLREAHPRLEAPAALRERVLGILAAPRRRSGPALWSATAATIALAVLLGSNLLERRARVDAQAAGGASAFAAMAADTHLRYARGQLPLEVQSDRPERLSQWFAGRVPFHLALPDYPVGPGEHKLYRLEGGRLVSFRNECAAYVAYRMDEQPISLVVTSAAAVAPEGGSLVKSVP